MGVLDTEHKQIFGSYTLKWLGGTTRHLFWTLPALFLRVELALTRVSAWVIIVLMFFTVSGVVSRYFLNKPLKGTMELTELAMPVVVFLGLAYTQMQGGHIRVGLFVDKLGGRRRCGIQAVALIITLFFFAMILWYGGEHAWRAISIGDNTVQGYPIWPSKIMIPIGSGLMCIRLSMQLMATLKSLFTPAMRASSFDVDSSRAGPGWSSESGED